MEYVMAYITITPKRLVAMLAIMSLAACDSMPSFTKPGLSADQAKADQQTCYYEAEKATVGMTANLDNALVQRSENIQLTTHCMQLNGYQPHP